MPKRIHAEVPIEKLKWTLDPKILKIATTDDLEPQTEIIGQKRGVEAFRFGMGMHKKGYNIFVTGQPGIGRLSSVKKLLDEMTDKNRTPDDICYVNNFKSPEAPIQLRFEAGEGGHFKKDMQDFLDTVKREAPQLFESEEYIARKNQIAEAHEKKVMSFYKAIEDQVKDTGLVVVRMQMGPIQRPDVVPLVDGEPKRMIELEEMVENGRFPKDEFVRLQQKRLELKEEIDSIVQELKLIQKDVGKKHEEVDRLMFTALAQDFLQPLKAKYSDKKTLTYLDSVLEHMADDLESIKALGSTGQQGPLPGMMFAGPSAEMVFQPYQVNLLVDNSELVGPPIIVESYPTYRNLFGSIERVQDRTGGWHTDYTKIKAGSFVKANGGYLVINLMDAIYEPGVWQTLKRSLKTEQIEIETFDPYYFISATGLKPEPIDMEVKVVVLGSPYLYMMLKYYDEDVPKIFKIRADYESSMNISDDSVLQIARFIRSEVDKCGLKPFDASALGAVMEEAVRWAGRQEKISTAFPSMADLLSESNYYAMKDEVEQVNASHVKEAIRGKIYRSNQVEERLQEMIDRGSLLVETKGAVVGQVNGLAVYSMGDYAFGRPSRITAVTSLGKEGIINIEREAEMSGPTHNKGMLILAGFLRSRFAQDKPLSLAASIAFEQSYGGIDGDSASSTELYAILSSLSETPLKQNIAVTGSVNQYGEIQPIGGVNEKIEGFYLCCKSAGLTGDQGVMIPHPNIKDLMVRDEVIDAVKAGDFHIWAVKTVDEGVELLTGVPAGVKGKNGDYPKKSINGMVNAKLKKLGEMLMALTKEDDGETK
ncbi:Lon protease family protein [Pseudodesulfovibrio piezophilus]|uniref:endopeptidase La n=1 Tax=Pseudodesulfovibrio piezophilus (strain DSM 21447 / JCM 15486 / C1TLV30) TaxID=1322246 RepID=M1WLC8_PSEP2|nr:ATP-binding protein [Pseudodesulfovibrio piezophilus]CCH47640.1 Peptidase S16 lon domain protein [Pseudodesulfovibrio piezophilus C1TLV30]